MKFAHTLGIVLSAALVPALAHADSTNPDPNAPTPAPQPTTTVVVQPAPAPQPVPPPTVVQPEAQPPVIVVNPQTPAPMPRAVPVQEESEEVYDTWNAPVFTTGALILGASYGASAIVAGTSNHVGADRLYVPVAGPWLALNDWGNCPITNASCDTNTTDKVLLIADGVFQAAGVLTMLDGLLQPSSHRVITRTTDRAVHVAPSHNGVQVFGHF